MRVENIWPEWTQEELLGSGSFGKVYKVKKEQYGVTSYAAIKILDIPQSQSELRELKTQGMDEKSISVYYGEMVQELMSEIQIMESLKSAGNIVSIEDSTVIEHKDKMGYTICIRMELLKSLSSYQSEHKMTVKEIVKLGKDICDALSCCRKEHIIHRDIKPDNIFINKYGTFKLGDFGISRQLERTQSAASQKGTNLYMAPEVYKGESYTHLVDIYSLGIMLFRLLNNGRFPFMPPAPQPIKYDDTQKALKRRMSGEALPDPVNADAKLSRIICKAAALDPAQRYQSAEEMKEALIEWEQRENTEETDTTWNLYDTEETDTTWNLYDTGAAHDYEEVLKSMDEMMGVFNGSSEENTQAGFVDQGYHAADNAVGEKETSYASKEDSYEEKTIAGFEKGTNTKKEGKSTIKNTILGILLIWIVYFVVRMLAACVAGGASSNTSGNSNIIEVPEFEDIFVPAENAGTEIEKPIVNEE